ncbi:hypothetical protein ACQEU6_23740 [Spirillospora sp. CA-108201]
MLQTSGAQYGSSRSMDASRRSRSRVIRFASRGRPARSAAVPAAHSAELVSTGSPAARAAATAAAGPASGAPPPGPRPARSAASSSRSNTCWLDVVLTCAHPAPARSSRAAEAGSSARAAAVR